MAFNDKVQNMRHRERVFEDFTLIKNHFIQPNGEDTEIWSIIQTNIIKDLTFHFCFKSKNEHSFPAICDRERRTSLQNVPYKNVCHLFTFTDFC